jgi:hypothetical protein
MCFTTNIKSARIPFVGFNIFCFGDIAQLVERLNGIQEVRGSTPLISTKKRRARKCILRFLFEGESKGALRNCASGTILATRLDEIDCLR